MINDIIKEYIYEINAIFEEGINVGSKILDNQELEDDVYKAFIIVMCIKYETFTTELFVELVKNKSIIHNRPWYYTRELANRLDVNIDQEYKEAKACWEFYNTLKHVNKTTMKDRQRILEKYHISSKKTALSWIHTALIKLLDKFLIKQKQY